MHLSASSQAQDVAPDNEDSSGRGLTLSSVLQALWRSWPWILAALALGVVVSGLYTTRERKIYRSSSTLEIDPSPPRPLGSDVKTVVDVAAGSYWVNREYYETQLRIITSSGVGMEVVRRLNLHREPAFIENLPAGAKPPRREIPLDTAFRVLRGRISVEPIKNSRLVVVHVEDANPARAQRILSMVLDTYLEQNIDRALAAATSSAEWLGGQLGTLKDELDASELNLHEYKKSHSILSVSLDEQTNMLRREMTELNDQVTRVRAQIEVINARFNELKKIKPDDPSDVSASELLGSPALQSLRGHYVEARTARLSLMAMGRGENHPEVRSTLAREELLRSELLNEVRNVQFSVEHDLAAARQAAAGLMGLFLAAEKRALDLNLLEIEYRRHEREKVNTEKLYTLVLERTKEADLTRMMRFNNLRVIEPPAMPVAPIRPSLPLNLATGAALGLLLGFLAAVVRERLDRTVKSGAVVEELGIPFLGSLPHVNDDGGVSGYGKRSRRRSRLHPVDDTALELVVHARPKSGAAEACRAIRTSIRFSSPDRPYQCMLVTSAGPAEGKTTVACCIAVSMAQAGQRTLILDCDLRRPRLHKVFGVGNDRGTTNSVIDPSTLDESIYPTQVENLFVLPSGPHAPNPADLINSERFAEFIQGLRKRFDMVLIDSPPLLPVTDAAILSTRVDGTLLVIRSERTLRDSVARAGRTLRDVGGRVVGAILNGLEPGTQSGKYYYTYYGTEENAAAPASRRAANG